MSIIDKLICKVHGHRWVRIISKGESYKDPMKQVFICDRCGAIHNKK